MPGSLARKAGDRELAAMERGVAAAGPAACRAGRERYNRVDRIFPAYDFR